jgi:hypothetical protein
MVLLSTPAWFYFAAIGASASFVNGMDRDAKRPPLKNCLEKEKPKKRAFLSR